MKSQILVLMLAGMLVLSLAGPASARQWSNSEDLFFTEDFTTYDHLGDLSRVEWDRFQGELRLQPSDTIPQLLLDMHKLPDETTLLAWLWETGEQRGISLQRYDTRSNPMWQQEQVVWQIDLPDFWSPAAFFIGVDAFNQVSVLYTTPGGGLAGTVYLRKYELSGQPLFDTAVTFSIGDGYPSFALAEDGTIAIAWSTGGGNLNQVYAQRVAPDGSVYWPGPVLLAQYEVGEVSVDIDPWHNLVVAWRKIEQDRGRIYVQRISADGVISWPGPARMGEVTAQSDLFDPRVAFDRWDGSAYVAWRGKSDPFGPTHLYLQRLSTAGESSWGADRRVDPDSPVMEMHQYDLQVIYANNAAVWWKASSRQEGPYYTRVFPRSGQAPSDPIELNFQLKPEDRFLSLAMGTSKTWTIVYRPGDVFDSDLAIQTLDEGGKPTHSTAQRVGKANGRAHQMRPEITTGPYGMAQVAWYDSRQLDLDVFLQRFNRDAWPMLPYDVHLYRSPFSGPGSGVEKLVVSGDGQGNTVFAWFTSESETSRKLQLHKIGQDGTATWSKPVVVTSSATFDPAALAVDLGGNIYVAWSVADGPWDNSRALRLRKYSPAGKPLWSSAKPVGVSAAEGEIYRQQIAPVLDTTGAGEVLVAWSHLRHYEVSDGPTDTWEIRAQHLSKDGVPSWAEDLRIPQYQDIGAAYDRIGVGLSESGAAYIAWRLREHEKEHDLEFVTVQRYTPAGQPEWGSPLKIPAETEYLDLDADGDIAVVAFPVTLPDRKVLYATQVRQDGTLGWTTEVVSIDPPNSSTVELKPSLAVLPGGDALLAWEMEEGASGHNAYWTKVNNNGSIAWFNLVGVVQEGYFFAPSGSAMSDIVAQSNTKLLKATLTVDADLKDGSVKWFLSADGGQNWETVTPGKAHIFKNAGNQLRWRADLKVGNGGHSSPVVRSLTIAYQTEEAPIVIYGNQTFLPSITK